MGCCCRRKRFLTNMQKMISPCMLLALRENEAAMDVSFYFIRLREFLPPANEVWGKVIFSEACVKNSVHRGGAWSWGWVPGPWGVPGPGVQVQAHNQGGSWGGTGQAHPLTATAAGGMLPTGMNSCLFDAYCISLLF